MTTAITLTEHGASRMNEAAIEVDVLGVTIQGVPDFEDFCQLLESLYDDEDRGKWGIPDALVWAEDTNAYGDDWYQVLNGRRIHPGTLANRKSIVRKFPKAKRRWKLSQRHYAALTSLMPDNETLALELLEQAFNTEMTSEDLFKAKKARLNEPVPDTFQTTLVYKLIDGRGYFVSEIDPPSWVTEGYKSDVTFKERAA